MFSCQRFQDIFHTMLHVGNPDTEGKEKIEPFINMILSNFQREFYPFEEVSIDEMVVGFKGRWLFKQFNATRPKKYHIKTFGLCDPAIGYVLNILTYFGGDTSYKPECDPDGSHAVKIFETLLTPLGTGHKIFADRFYTTRVLIDYLLQKKQYYTGTVNLNRKGFPEEIKDEHRQMKWFAKEDEAILCVAFRDKKAKKNVVMASTDATVATIKKKML
ncbi:PiggyBac transposable element-derived protein 4-like [Plakobranchus ocellatus]|uniref:PiggyBac transposable element-derived protein 4-like n=1 Tax=Plakobranchus ocellatus TaxID=259542 RepID=A0AAV4BVT8_9GAST|nr:PiggyBac transposable element-derived protein 4-like [Plakobranchus ocellatus]